MPTLFLAQKRIGTINELCSFLLTFYCDLLLSKK